MCAAAGLIPGAMLTRGRKTPRRSEIPLQTSFATAGPRSRGHEDQGGVDGGTVTRRRARSMRAHDRVDSEIRAAIKILLPDHDRRVDTAATTGRMSGEAGKRGSARLGERLIGGDL